jgi:Phage tail assembly chaperone proteins, E, or 41 or 14
MAKQPEKNEEKPDIAFEYPLAQPINAYNEEVSILKIRKPTGIDLIEVGNPVTFYPYADPVKVEHDFPKVRKMVARLANVPSSSVDRISPQDLIGLAWAISPFFIPAL